ncbi:MAG TPA: hypothetical protein VEW95_05010 [Candidatus Limnocylindrales bacterium]|nr:hypothetical protein [Candidatus Limnocylindrales bacterium]
MTVRVATPPRLIRIFPARFIARATGANVRTAERWRGGQSPQARFRDRIGELQAVLDMLGRGMTDAAKRTWLEAPNAAIGWQRPVDRLAAGDFDAVRAAAESYDVGDYV